MRNKANLGAAVQADEVDVAASNVKTPSRPSPKSDSVSVLNLSPYRPRTAGHLSVLQVVEIGWMEFVSHR